MRSMNSYHSHILNKGISELEDTSLVVALASLSDLRDARTELRTLRLRRQGGFAIRRLAIEWATS